VKFHGVFFIEFEIGKNVITYMTTRLFPHCSTIRTITQALLHLLQLFQLFFWLEWVMLHWHLAIGKWVTRRRESRT